MVSGLIVGVTQFYTANRPLPKLSADQVDFAFRQFGMDQSIELMVLEVGLGSSPVSVIEIRPQDIVSPIHIVFTGEDGRPPEDFPPERSREAFARFSEDHGRWKGALHMFFVLDQGKNPDLHLFIRHGEDGVQVMEDDRLSYRSVPKQAQSTRVRVSLKPPFIHVG